jgi:prepilin peptidase CpaA
VTLPFALAAASVALVGAARDVKTGHIPNWLTLGALGIAPLAHAGAAAARTGSLRVIFVSVLSSLVGAALCGALPWVLFAKGALGGGDVKLFAAMGALAGPFVGFRAELIAFILGAVYALALAAGARRVGVVMGNVGALLGRASQSDPTDGAVPELMPVRFGPVIFAGMLVSACLQWRAP